MRILDELENEYLEDIREKNADDDHLRAFKIGWADQLSEDRRSYGNDALKTLTWQNVGYRLAKVFGAQDEEAIQNVFLMLKLEYSRQG